MSTGNLPNIISHPIPLRSSGNTADLWKGQIYLSVLKFAMMSCDGHPAKKVPLLNEGVDLLREGRKPKPCPQSFLVCPAVVIKSFT